MLTNTLPHYDDSDAPTGCCPRFNPAGWDGRRLHFRDKPFIRATSHSLLHVPLNIGRIFERVQRKMVEADAYDPENCIILSRDLSPWTAEHLFSTAAPVPEEEIVRLSGDFITRVFEGPYRQTQDWHADMQAAARAAGATEDEVYFFYTTCPKCAKAYGKNYVVGVARTG